MSADWTRLSRRGFLGAGVGVAPAALIARSGSAASAGVATVYASSYGPNRPDGTQARPVALNSGAGTVVIDNGPGGWITGPLALGASSNINPAGRQGRPTAGRGEK